MAMCKTMHGARENGALLDAISRLHRFRARHSHSPNLYGYDDSRERYIGDDAVCRNTRLSSSRCALCRSQRSPMKENAADSCELSLSRNQSDGRAGCCLRQQPTPVKWPASKNVRKESCDLAPRLVRPDDRHAGDGCDVPTDVRQSHCSSASATSAMLFDGIGVEASDANE
jgi:hypothetical protein